VGHPNGSTALNELADIVVTATLPGAGAGAVDTDVVLAIQGERSLNAGDVQPNDGIWL
jgi:hypothetical protein